MDVEATTQLDEIAVPTEKLRSLFDIAVESMDFGSGFLEDDEVELLREIAVLLGLDPAVGTPETFYDKYLVALSAAEHETRMQYIGHPRLDDPVFGPSERRRLDRLQARYDATNGAVRD